jgi:tRNA pseudouridine13 synthase
LRASSRAPPDASQSKSASRTAAEFVGVNGEGYAVIAAAEHQRKLPRGALAGNRFEIVLRGVNADAGTIAARVAQIAAGGVPNYFGPQRFGRDAGNLDAVLREAARVADGGRRGRDDGFTLSAARSVVFNAVLAERVTRGDWNRLLPGDVANLDGRGSVFAVPVVDDALAVRCAALELHPTAPLPGDGESLSTGDIRELEESVGAQFPEAHAVIRGARMNAERRALRMRVAQLGYRLDADALRLSFSLGSGSFATTVLREIISTDAAGE